MQLTVKYVSYKCSYKALYMTVLFLGYGLKNIICLFDTQAKTNHSKSPSVTQCLWLSVIMG